MTDELIGAKAAAKRSQRRLKAIMEGIPNNGGVFQELRSKLRDLLEDIDEIVDALEPWTIP